MKIKKTILGFLSSVLALFTVVSFVVGLVCISSIDSNLSESSSLKLFCIGFFLLVGSLMTVLAYSQKVTE